MTGDSPVSPGRPPGTLDDGFGRIAAKAGAGPYLGQAVLDEIEKARASGDLPKFRPERCFVCCEATSKDLVNKLLALGMTNREIVEACEAINELRREHKDDRIIESYHVRWHRRDHFNVQNPAQAAYREIMERRAEEMNADHINGVGFAVTALAALETAMVKGYGNMVTGDTQVSVRDMIDAAVKLHVLTATDAKRIKTADLIHRLDRIITAAQRFIPPEHHAEFAAVVQGQQSAYQPMPLLSPSQPFREFSHDNDDDDDAEY